MANTIPVVAIVGRPNVGKSLFFNRIAGSKLSIVEDEHGVTRDRVYSEAEWRGKKFALIDTGGIDDGRSEEIFSHMREQAMIAIDMADIILFMVDGKEGITSQDTSVAELLRRAMKKVLLIVNKVDGGRLPDDFYDFYELGFGEPLPVSSANMTGLGDVLDEIIDGLPDSTPEVKYDDDDDRIHLAIIGKPNVGKSSFVNAILGEKRVIVSDKPGTTRDSIDTPFTYEDEKFVLIDTAGIRRKSKVTEGIERFSVLRAIAAIERSDVCLVMIDAAEGITKKKKKVAGLAHDSGKGVVLAINKWDLIEKDGKTMDVWRGKMRNELPFLSYAPDVFISVKDGQRLRNVLEIVSAVNNNRSLRISTSHLNGLIRDAVAMKPPPTDKGKRLKIYYVSQVGVKPPLFLFKINKRDLMHFSYSRYLENRIREGYGFTGTPVSFIFREKGENDE
jgi:GTP-binding protein